MASATEEGLVQTLPPGQVHSLKDLMIPALVRCGVVTARTQALFEEIGVPVNQGMAILKALEDAKSDRNILHAAGINYLGIFGCLATLGWLYLVPHQPLLSAFRRFIVYFSQIIYKYANSIPIIVVLLGNSVRFYGLISYLFPIIRANTKQIIDLV